MNDLLAWAAQNTLAALVFAVFVGGLMRVWRNPPVAHILWLLVLLKLVAPPLLRVDWSGLQRPALKHSVEQYLADGPPIGAQTAEGRSVLVDRPIDRSTVQVLGASVNEHDFAASLPLYWNRVAPVLLGLWLGGAALCALVIARRIVRFERLLRDTLPASERLQRLASQIAGRLGIRPVPDVRYAECALVPLLWCAGGRPTIVLPINLFCQLDDQSAALILSHELAHLRRRDHWVRAFELIVSTIYWWNPLVWVIRRQMHQAEELCCDAWVRWTFPNCTKRYAELLLKSAESLSSPHVGARLLPASPFLRSHSLKARIETMIEREFAPCVSRRSLFIIALCALVVLPWFVQTTQTEVQARSNDEPRSAAAGKSATPPSEFPYAVRFEQGATRFLDGDQITILEVRGTADRFMKHNFYRIKGTYTLASHNRAHLAAYITAIDAENASGSSLKEQSTTINQGNGTFTLLLPMNHRGLPHVSFYPADGGGDFGGNYFGTGDSVLKRWWGSKETEPKATSAAGRSTSEAALTASRSPDTRTTSDFPFSVPFEQGATRFLDGDKISIVEVRGTAETFAPGNIYFVKGTYSLASRDRAVVAAYTTAMDAANGRGVPLKVQSTIVTRGNGTFTLYLPMSCRGWPHVSFYPSDGGGDFGGNYFGTGDSVLKRWWGSAGAH